jgi:hypothetical protein
MKKLTFPLFLFCIIVLPMLLLYLADKHGAITNPIETESKFIHFISQEVTKNLSPEEKNILTDRFKENSLDLKTSDKNLLSREYGDGSFLCIFYNDVLIDKDWYKYSFGKRSNGDYYSLKIKTGIFEKIILSKFSSGDEIVLFEHYIPLRQNNINTLQTNLIGGHFILLLNKRIFFHLLLEDKVLPGGISFSGHAPDRWKDCRAEFSPLPAEIKEKMNNLLTKIPCLQIKSGKIY